MLHTEAQMYHIHTNIMDMPPELPRANGDHAHLQQVILYSQINSMDTTNEHLPNAQNRGELKHPKRRIGWSILLLLITGGGTLNLPFRSPSSKCTETNFGGEERYSEPLNVKG